MHPPMTRMTCDLSQRGCRHGRRIADQGLVHRLAMCNWALGALAGGKGRLLCHAARPTPPMPVAAPPLTRLPTVPSMSSHADAGERHVLLSAFPWVLGCCSGMFVQLSNVRVLRLALGSRCSAVCSHSCVHVCRRAYGYTVGTWNLAWKRGSLATLRRVEVLSATAV